MTDTELILSKLDEMRTELKGDIQDVRMELKGDIQDVRTELKDDMQSLQTRLNESMQDMHIELSGKIAAVQSAVSDLRERMDVMEFGLQTEIEKTYELAQENAHNIRILMADRARNCQRKAKIRLITDYKN